MTRITQILAVPGTGAYYYEDLSALQASSTSIDKRYTTTPRTPGFKAVREVSEAVSVGLVLDDTQIVWGDCVAVAYSGKSGRAPIFRAEDCVRSIQQTIKPVLQGKEVTTFRELVEKIDGLVETVQVDKPPEQPENVSRRDLLAAPFRLLRQAIDDEVTEANQQPNTPGDTVSITQSLHTATCFGVSQALLRATATVSNLTMAEVISREWDLALPDAPVPIHAQSGSARYENADKMIVRKVASLPHSLVDNIPKQVGETGSELEKYIYWLKKRISDLGGHGYHPTIHLDLHGAFGKIFKNDLGRILGQLYVLEKAAQPYPLRIECPILMDSREAQIKIMKKLVDYVGFRKMDVKIVVDEWANTVDDIKAFIEAGAAHMIQIKMPDLGGIHHTVEAVLACKNNDVGAFLGGSCAETDLSAKAAVHIALATRPEIIMAKPGMGVDEGVQLVQNEMFRTLAWIDAKHN